MNLINVPRKLTANDLPISEELVSIINDQITSLLTDACLCSGIVISFKDPSYSSTAGGYHPDEIRIEIKNSEWVFDYITDFCYEGIEFAELIKEVDWLVQDGQCYTKYTGWLSVGDSNDYFTLWQSNFISYVEMGVFEISVSSDDC